jgi:hypothetical protein
MIYCVVPRTAPDELFHQLLEYYKDDTNVTVIVDRRQGDRRGRGDATSAGDQRREVRDRRRKRVAGELSTMATPSG